MECLSEFERLLSRVREGDNEAAWQLISDYGPHVVAVVRRRLSRQIRVRVDSQDLVQAVWKSFFLDMAGIETIRSPEQLVAVLVAMTQNKVVDAYRRHAFASRRDIDRERSIHQVAETTKTLSVDNSTPSQFAMARERWQQMLGERPPVHQQVIRLRLAGETFDSIAVKLGISERTARRVIDDLWHEHCHDET